jgi:hypothetical protein
LERLAKEWFRPQAMVRATLRLPQTHALLTHVVFDSQNTFYFQFIAI